MILDLNEEVRRKYASFWLRVGAGILDGIALYAFFHLFALLTGIYIVWWSEIYFLTNWESAIVFLAVCWLYFAGLESSEYQASLGKMVFKIRVCDLELNRINFYKSTVRFFFKLASISIALMGVVLIAIHPKHQGLHDVLAKAVVIQD